MGEPGDVAGQTNVLKRALALLDYCGPEAVIEDYPDAVVGSKEPLIDLVTNTDLMQEFGVIKTAYDRFVAEHGSSTFGNSGMSPGEIVAGINKLLEARVDGKRIPSKQIRFMVDDLKSLYFEAACQGHSALSSAQLGDWFWRKTAAGRAIADLRSEFQVSDDKGRQKIVNFLVPGEWVDNLGLKI